MGAPSIFFKSCKTDIYVTEKALTASGLKTVISDKAAELLRYRTTIADREDRRDVFRYIENDDKHRFAAFTDTLYNFTKALEQYDNCTDEIKRFIIFEKVLRTYDTMLRGSSHLWTEDGFFIGRLYEYTDSLDDDFPDFTRMKDEYSSICAEVSNGRMAVSGGKAYAVSGDEDTGRFITERLIHDISALGYCVTERPDLSSAENVTIPLDMVYPEKYRRLKELYRDLVPMVDRTYAAILPEALLYRQISGHLMKYASDEHKVTYPVCTDSQICVINGLYSPMIMKSDISSVPNDVHLSPDLSAWAVEGKAESGKSSYIQSAVSAIIMSLSGAPIMASSAEVMDFDSIRTLDDPCGEETDKNTLVFGDVTDGATMTETVKLLSSPPERTYILAELHTDHSDAPHCLSAYHYPREKSEIPYVLTSSELACPSYLVDRLLKAEKMTPDEIMYRMKYGWNKND